MRQLVDTERHTFCVSQNEQQSSHERTCKKLLMAMLKVALARDGRERLKKRFDMNYKSDVTFVQFIECHAYISIIARCLVSVI